MGKTKRWQGIMALSTILLVLAIFPASSAFAYQIKFMYPYSDEEKEYFYNKINLINPTYFENLKEIRIYNPEKTLFGWEGLFVSYVNHIYINTNIGNFNWVLKHELAHLYCFNKEGKLSMNNQFHRGCFKEIKKKTG